MNTLKILPIGGINEIGMNQYLFSYGTSSFLLDAGIAFPKDGFLGIDAVVANYKKFFQSYPDVKTLYITHGHEDHIGAITHLLSEKDIEIYAPSYAVELIKYKCTKYFGDKKKLRIHKIKNNFLYKEGDFSLEYLWTNHSIPDTASIFIKTPVGNVLFSSDYRLNGDIDFLGTIDAVTTEHGSISMLFSDSTNALEEGVSVSDKDVEKALDLIFKNSDGKIIVTLFSSHIDRINMIMRLCHKNKKKLFLSGFNLSIHTDIARKLAYLEDLNVMHESSKYKKTPKEDVVILCTGSQGEENSSVVKLSKDMHPFASIEAGDTIIFSSSIIPGNEREILNTINSFITKGANVFTDDKSIVHTTGHACSEEIRKMIEHIKPKYYIPVHGEPVHLKANIEIAKSLGIYNNIVLLKDNFLVFDKNKYWFEKVKDPIERLFIDKSTGCLIGKDVLKERKKIASNGVLNLSIVFRNNAVVKVKISSLGVFRSKEVNSIFKKLETKVFNFCNNKKDKKDDAEKVKNLCKQEFRNYFRDKPEVLVNIIKI